MPQPDLLLLFSDQHHVRYSGFAGDELARTPNLDALAEDGTVFESAYTSCPICVPARCSFLTTQLTSRLGIFGNAGALRGDQPTFMHSLAAEGYETVLCGRMHFKGIDQRHGFTKRIMGEITVASWGVGGDLRTDFGDYMGWKVNPEFVGGGNSFSLEYDEAVIRAAIDYLGRDHEKPQCLVVSIHAPHPPYVAPPRLYRYYRESVGMPDAPQEALNYRNRSLNGRRPEHTDELILGVRAAYYGMVENVDRQIGMVRAAWENYLNRDRRQGLFTYFSDHGEQAGERWLFGKQTFFEGSAAIPMIFQGDGILSAARISSAANIMDIGITLCELTEATPPPVSDGRSLLPELTGGRQNDERVSLSEYVYAGEKDSVVPGRMIRQGRWKLMAYGEGDEEDLLFDIESDQLELRNLLHEHPEVAQALRTRLRQDWDVESIADTYRIRREEARLLAKWGAAVQYPEPDRWPIPPHAQKRPYIF